MGEDYCDSLHCHTIYSSQHNFQHCQCKTFRFLKSFGDFPISGFSVTKIYRICCFMLLLQYYEIQKSIQNSLVCNIFDFFILKKLNNQHFRYRQDEIFLWPFYWDAPIQFIGAILQTKKSNQHKPVRIFGLKKAQSCFRENFSHISPVLLAKWRCGILCPKA